MQKPRTVAAAYRLAPHGWLDCCLIEARTTTPACGPPPSITDEENSLQLDLMEPFSQLMLPPSFIKLTIARARLT